MNIPSPFSTIMERVVVGEVIVRSESENSQPIGCMVVVRRQGLVVIPEVLQIHFHLTSHSRVREPGDGLLSLADETISEPYERTQTSRR